MANEMRDRLYDLLGECEKKYSAYYEEFIKRLDKAETQADFEKIYDGIIKKHDFFADHLIENGVIVPPCKVGDEIWYITTSYMTKIPKAQKGYVEKIIITKNGIDLIADNYVSKLTYGKRSFLTKSEAEQKLKEMRGGNDL